MKKLLIITSCLLFLGCKKEKLREKDNTLVYESSYFTPLEIKPSFFLDKLIVENADPYQDMLGEIHYEMTGSLTNGEPNWYSDTKIKSTRINIAEVHIISDEQFVKDHLIDSKIIYSYPTGDAPVETTLATFKDFDYNNGTINYNFSNEDYSSLFVNNSFGHIFISFEFDSNAVTYPIKLYYSLSFNYEYSYLQKEN